MYSIALRGNNLCDTRVRVPPDPLFGSALESTVQRVMS